MRQSTLFGRTLREAPAEAQTPGHRLMLRAAIARPLASGLYTWLPLGFRVAKKVEQIIREEQNRIGACSTVPRAHYRARKSPRAAAGP